ncbi:hypothetical protein DPMN_068748 [Dreissena polymorpha]|uniref:Uncharacterized protein n=1 Tax=Dreissena polymorpha TaxID=45954 RepID=A0A9D3Z1R0_DREPO|nr:hypothetical protein DPMN_068748 [Dreissena polymorpha]
MRGINMDIIESYTTTNVSEEDEEDNFYNRLANHNSRQTKKEHHHLMGIFNALIGIDNQGYDEIMEKQGLSEMCDNGEPQVTCKRVFG